MTTLEMVCEARRDDALQVLAQYHLTPRWRWFRRGRLLHDAHLLAVEYERLRRRTGEEG